MLCVWARLSSVPFDEPLYKYVPYDVLSLLQLGCDIVVFGVLHADVSQFALFSFIIW